MRIETQRRSLLLVGCALCSIGLCSFTIIHWHQLRQETAQLRTASAFTQMELDAALHAMEQERQRRAGSVLALRRRPMGHEVLQVMQRIPSSFRVQTIIGTDQEWQLTGIPAGTEETARVTPADPPPPQTLIVPRVENTQQRNTEIAP